MLNMTQAKVQELDTEKRKEITSLQNEIKKLEEDIEGLKNKMKNKENNPHYVMVNEFFGEVKTYIEQYKEIFNEGESSKQHKSKIFELRKKLNDIDYQASQAELALKKKLDEGLRQKKEELENAAQTYLSEIESERNKIVNL